jgi:ABC-type transporter Mla subunit MlaD
MLRSIAVLVSVLALALGCASSKPAGSEAAASIAELRDLLTTSGNQVTKTIDSLQRLMTTTGDLTPAYKEFAENVKVTEKQGEKVKDTAKKMREKSADYMEKWYAESQGSNDASLNQLSAERQAQVRSQFENLRAIGQRTAAAYDPFLKGLKDVQKHLDRDLTASGLAVAGPTAQMTIAEGRKVQEGISSYQAALNQLAAAWSARM